MARRSASSVVVRRPDSVVKPGGTLSPPMLDEGGSRARELAKALGKYSECAIEIGQVMAECEWSVKAKLAAGLIVSTEVARRALCLTREEYLELCDLLYSGQVHYVMGLDADEPWED